MNTNVFFFLRFVVLAIPLFIRLFVVQTQAHVFVIVAVAVVVEKYFEKCCSYWAVTGTRFVASTRWNTKTTGPPIRLLELLFFTYSA